VPAVFPFALTCSGPDGPCNVTMSLVSGAGVAGVNGAVGGSMDDPVPAGVGPGGLELDVDGAAGEASVAADAVAAAGGLAVTLAGAAAGAGVAAGAGAAAGKLLDAPLERFFTVTTNWLSPEFWLWPGWISISKPPFVPEFWR
jgi:hypothetical protein